MRKRKVSWVLLFTVFIGLLPQILLAHSSIAQAVDELPDKILDRSGLKVTAQVTPNGENFQWMIAYDKESDVENEMQALKFKLKVDGQEVNFQEKTDFAYDTERWFTETAFSTQSQGTLIVITAQAVSEVTLEIQTDIKSIDETDLVSVSKNSLSSELQGPHTLAIPKITQTATTEMTQITESQPPMESTTDTTTGETETPPSETQTSDTTESSKTAETLKSSEVEEIVGPQNYYRSSAISTFAVSAYVDPFDYTPDGGQYPTYGTNNYTATSSSEMIKNYNYGKIGDTQSNVAIKNILSGTLDFANGYHAYDVGNNQEIYLKKIVMPTDDPTKFKIQLDMIGGMLQKRRNVDVVFVADKSGSMAGTRWTNLKSALNTFATGLLTDNADGAIQLGIAAFGSNANGGTPYGSIGNFGGTQGNYTGFTTSASAFTGHALLSGTPTGGTPTFLGLDAGLELLTNTAYNGRTDAEKILIILTDGLPTYYPTDTYITGANRIRQLTRESLESGRVEKFSTSSSTYFGGNGSDTSSTTRSQTIKHGNTRTSQNPEITRYAIGFNVSNVDDILTALGPAGQYSATSSTDLNNVMTAIKQRILDTSALIREANVFDPMSSYVTLDTTSVTKQALTLNTNSKTLSVTTGTQPAYVTATTVDTSGNKVNLSDLTLSGAVNQKNGLRLTYTVTLKEEYQDGTFYPANGPTYLADTHYTDPFGFAIPSVKVPPQTFDLNVEKIWTDDANAWGTRQNITLQLQAKAGSDDWTNVTGKTITIDKAATGNGLKGSFTGLSAYDSAHNKISYRIIEARVTGYNDPIYTPESVSIDSTDKTLKVTNELLKTKLEFTKVGNDEKTALTDAGFTLYKSDGTTVIVNEVLADTNGKVTFSTQIPIGSYILKETTTPLGYETSAPVTITVTDNNKALTVSGLTKNQIVNKLKDFKLIVTKKDNHGKALEGAKFKLVSKDNSYMQELTGVANIFTFTGLKPGEYTLTETVTPDGYVGLQAPITILIGQDGQVTIDGEKQSDVIRTDGNVITLDVANQQKGMLPSTGGSGTRPFMIAALIFLGTVSLIGGFYFYRNRKELS